MTHLPTLQPRIRWHLARSLPRLSSYCALHTRQAQTTEELVRVRRNSLARLRRHDGAWCWMQARGVPVLRDDGTVAEWVGVHRDVTLHREAAAQLDALAAEREHMVAQLTQGQRMETVGRLMGGVAHDFNNMLTAVLGNLELLQRRAGNEPTLQRLIGGTRQAAVRGAELVAGLLAFSRARAARTEALDLSALLDGFAPLLRHAVGTGISVELELDRTLPPVEADAGQLETAVLNVAFNARDAMGADGGALVIRTARAATDAIGERPGAVLSLSDTGPGLTPDALARCFEPRFTTKVAGRGSGLGLSQVAGFARQSGGYATVATVISVD
ncbi:MAG: PAS domain S-box protein, partial [Rhodospirillales bacterium]|nr:PAS domain S-box protein [Acetobacter sp.]